MGRPLRLMLYDRTCRGRRGLPGLSLSWKVGGGLYGALGRLDAWHGVESWDEGLTWLATHRAPEPIAEIQFWGHGRWGCAKVAGDVLDVKALQEGHPFHARLAAIRQRLMPREALWWFRTCETFGRAEGHRFARAWSRFFDCRAAGHTYVIGPFQSGLHSLGPDDEPTWPLDEGLFPGPPRVTARMSRPGEPNTITCFHGRVPAGY